MPEMNAAVVTSFGEPPRYSRFELPPPQGEGELMVEVLAAGLHPRVRSGAAGAHYTSTGALPMIPGFDGVGLRPDGRRIYFVSEDQVRGTMAERALVAQDRAVELPEDADPATVAATINPAMSSWVALRARVPLEPGQSVLVLGATGAAGGLALRAAKRLGAGRVVAAGRNLERLTALRAHDADEVVPLTDDANATSSALASSAAEVDIVLDYLWSRPAELALAALLRARADRGRALHWIQIGAIAGPTIELPSAALRSTNLHLLGSGQGSVSPVDYLAHLPSLIEEVRAGRIVLTPNCRPLADVEQAWAATDAPGERTVLVP